MDIPKDRVLFSEGLPGAAMWSGVLPRHHTLRLNDIEGGANVSMLLYNREQRYDGADTAGALEPVRGGCIGRDDVEQGGRRDPRLEHFACRGGLTRGQRCGVLAALGRDEQAPGTVCPARPEIQLDEAGGDAVGDDVVEFDGQGGGRGLHQRVEGVDAHRRCVAGSRLRCR